MHSLVPFSEGQLFSVTKYYKNVNRLIDKITIIYPLSCFLFSSLDTHFSELEIGFAIDGSASIQFYGKTNFQKLKDFVTKLTRSFNVSNNETRVGLIVYSTTSTLAFNLDRYSSLNRTVEAINNATYPGGGTFTGQALNLAATGLFNDSVIRANVSQVLVLVTDGVSTDDVIEPAGSLYSVFVYVVGIGKNYELSQLQRIARDKQERVFPTEFDKLQNVADDVRGQICLGNYKILYLLSQLKTLTKLCSDSNLIS